MYFEENFLRFAEIQLGIDKNTMRLSSGMHFKPLLKSKPSFL